MLLRWGNGSFLCGFFCCFFCTCMSGYVAGSPLPPFLYIVLSAAMRAVGDPLLFWCQRLFKHRTENRQLLCTQPPACLSFQHFTRRTAPCPNSASSPRECAAFRLAVVVAVLTLTGRWFVIIMLQFSCRQPTWCTYLRPFHFHFFILLTKARE